MGPSPSSPRRPEAGGPAPEPGAPGMAGDEDPAAPSLPAHDDGRRQLHPLPPGLVELYGLLAVLFVLVPEWMAGGALLGLRLGRPSDADLPLTSAAWQRLPELRLATLSLAELRQLARQEGIAGYGRMEREPLSQRLLARLRRRHGAAKTL